MKSACRDAVFRITLNVPFPLAVQEIKIQPSLARVNVNGLLDFRTEETSNSSETRLFSFFSPAKTIFAPDAAANRLRRIGNRAEAMTRIFIQLSTEISTFGLLSAFDLRISAFTSGRLQHWLGTFQTPIMGDRLEQMLDGLKVHRLDHVSVGA